MPSQREGYLVYVLLRIFCERIKSRVDVFFSMFPPGLGRVLDKSIRVQVQVLEKMTSTSTSTGFSKVLEYKYKYFEKYLSTSTEYFGCKLQLITWHLLNK